MLGLDPVSFTPSAVGVRAYDDLSRDAVGTTLIKLKIGPAVREVSFHIYDIESSLNMLLGRPWLHTAGARSTLHAPSMLEVRARQVITVAAEVLTKPKERGLRQKNC